MKTNFALFLFCLFALSCLGQNEASNWYFGENAGINFNIFTGAVTALNDGQINTREGCASISDSNGELLFYTDGQTVYNRTHSIMQNGNGLLGDESSTQSAIVVPKPNDPDIYYIFTVGSNQTNTGLNYSVVDMSSNSGLGGVQNKNVNLLSKSAEKISAVVKDCDTRSIWVITFGNSSGTQNFPVDTFYAYEINETGVKTTPIKSTFNLNITDVRGYLKLSPDGSKLACANVVSGLYLFGFDADTGTVTNSQRLQIQDQNDKPYGIEFSPDSKKLYVTSTNDYFNRDDASQNNKPENHFAVLLQYDLTVADVSNSMRVLDRRNNYRGALQLGPNGKIYRSLSLTYDKGFTGLGVINNPNELGTAASYEHNAIFLDGNNSTQGLPPFIASFFNQQIDIIGNGSDTSFLALCEGEEYTLVAEKILGATYIWTQDGKGLSESDFDLLISESGTYKVVIEPPGNTITNDCGFPQGEARVEVYEYPDAVDSSLFQCDLDLSTVGITTYNLNEATEIITTDLTDRTVTYYFNEDDAIAGINSIPNIDAFENNIPNQVIFARVMGDISGCFSTASLTLGISQATVANYVAQPICDEIDSPDGINTFDLKAYSSEIIASLLIPDTDLGVNYYKTFDDALLEQNEIEIYENTNPYSQVIYFRIENVNTNNCYGINEMQLKIETLPEIIEEETSYYCLNKYPKPITLNASIINGSSSDFTYDWSTGETSYEILINEPGMYTVQVTDEKGCTNIRNIAVESSNIAEFNSIEIVDASENNSITIIVSNEGVYEFALFKKDQLYSPFQTSNVFKNVSPGIYNIQVRDIKGGCGVIDKTISVIGFPKYFTPNNDGVNDTWNVFGLSREVQPNSKIFIYNRFGQLLKQLDPLGTGWDGTFNGNPLPTDDYWFSVTLQDGRTFKSHFTLKL
ncbi:T9SS type B sorting domain-containing protein [Changchengzhania lutea]|uniref:T9SS type B sorting domain-containing protein n=1 Tax=Changchengzhania lutea TaxID=2049305 RepID=UPI00115CD9AC|nr:T9SS type B sorting domain-containing protein [Changchengzhania lutea]